MLNNRLSDVIRLRLILIIMSYFASKRNSNNSANKLKAINVEHVKLFMFIALRKKLRKFSHKQELHRLGVPFFN